MPSHSLQSLSPGRQGQHNIYQKVCKHVQQQMCLQHWGWNNSSSAAMTGHVCDALFHICPRRVTSHFYMLLYQQYACCFGRGHVYLSTDNCLDPTMLMSQAEPNKSSASSNSNSCSRRSRQQTRQLTSQQQRARDQHSKQIRKQRQQQLTSQRQQCPVAATIKVIVAMMVEVPQPPEMTQHQSRMSR